MIFHRNNNIGHTIGFICTSTFTGTKTAEEYKMPYGDHRTAILEQEPAMICDAIDIIYSIYISMVMIFEIPLIHRISGPGIYYIQYQEMIQRNKQMMI